MNLIELVATTAPSDMFFAIGEQINALMGLILCLMAMWNRMENPKLTGGIILAAGTNGSYCPVSYAACSGFQRYGRCFRPASSRYWCSAR